MFERLKGLLGGLVAGGGRQFDESDHRLAAAALLIHIADADGDLDAEENARLRQIVTDRFDMDAADAARLVREAVESGHEAVGVDYFVNVLKRALDEDGRLKLVEMMWDMVYADGDATETEESVIWRLGGMLGVSEKDRETLRRSRSPGHWPEPSL